MCSSSLPLDTGTPEPPISKHPRFPFAFVELHRLAVRRPLWSRLVGLPTCRKHLKQTSYSIFSQIVHSESTETFEVQMHRLPKIYGPTHGYTHIHTRIRIHTHVHVHIHVEVHLHTHVHIYTHTKNYAHTYTCTCTFTSTCTHANAFTDTCTYTYTFAYI